MALGPVAARGAARPARRARRRSRPSSRPGPRGRADRRRAPRRNRGWPRGGRARRAGGRGARRSARTGRRRAAAGPRRAGRGCAASITPSTASARVRSMPAGEERAERELARLGLPGARRQAVGQDQARPAAASRRGGSRRRPGRCRSAGPARARASTGSERPQPVDPQRAPPDARRTSAAGAVADRARSPRGRSTSASGPSSRTMPAEPGPGRAGDRRDRVGRVEGDAVDRVATLRRRPLPAGVAASAAPSACSRSRLGRGPCRRRVVGDLAVGRVLAGFVEDPLPELGELARGLGRRTVAARRGPCRRRRRRRRCRRPDLVSPTVVRPPPAQRRACVTLGSSSRSPICPEAARDEVDAQARGDLVEHEAHEDHHVLHHLLLLLGLGRRGRRREELGLHQHQRDDQERQQVEAVAQERDVDGEPEQHVGRGEVADPEERRVPEGDAGVQRLPEPDEDRQLDQGGQAAADRVDPVLLVEGEGLLGLLLLVVLVLLLDLLEVAAGGPASSGPAAPACGRAGTSGTRTSMVSRMIAMP